MDLFSGRQRLEGHVVCDAGSVDDLAEFEEPISHQPLRERLITHHGATERRPDRTPITLRQLARLPLVASGANDHSGFCMSAQERTRFHNEIAGYATRRGPGPLRQKY